MANETPIRKLGLNDAGMRLTAEELANANFSGTLHVRTCFHSWPQVSLQVAVGTLSEGDHDEHTENR